MVDLVKVVIEILGTFFFLSVIVRTTHPNLNSIEYPPLAIAAALFAAIYFGYQSGANFNPAVSFALFMKNKLELNVLIAYVLAQLIGAALAVKFDNLIYYGNW